jgi:hypothetical protein
MYSWQVTSVHHREFVRSELNSVIIATLGRFKRVTLGVKDWGDAVQAVLLKNDQYEADYIVYFCSRLRKALQAPYETLDLSIEESNRRLDELALLRWELPFIAGGVPAA